MAASLYFPAQSFEFTANATNNLEIEIKASIQIMIPWTRINNLFENQN